MNTPTLRLRRLPHHDRMRWTVAQAHGLHPGCICAEREGEAIRQLVVVSRQITPDGDIALEMWDPDRTVYPARDITIDPPLPPTVDAAHGQTRSLLVSPNHPMQIRHDLTYAPPAS